MTRDERRELRRARRHLEGVLASGCNAETSSLAKAWLRGADSIEADDPRPPLLLRLRLRLAGVDAG